MSWDVLGDFRGNYVITYDMIQCERHPFLIKCALGRISFLDTARGKKSQKTLNKVDCIVGRGWFLVHTVQNSYIVSGE